LVRGLRRLLIQSVPQGVLDASDRVLDFAGSFFVPTLDLKLGVTGGLAHSFFRSAFGLFDGSFDTIFVHGLYPLFLRRPAGQVPCWADANAETANVWPQGRVG
jgi:hypothetical protein